LGRSASYKDPMIFVPDREPLIRNREKSHDGRRLS
jgi:hypothetical protein